MTRLIDRASTAAAVAFGGAGLFHLAALKIRPFAGATYAATYPAWRHVVFVIVNVTFAFLFLRRPRWLLVPALVLFVQILNGHGRDVVYGCAGPSACRWMSLLAVIGGGLAVCLATADLVQRRTERQP
jgi:hypothetical protein